MTWRANVTGQAGGWRIAPRWMQDYRREQLPGDIAAGVMVTIIIVPQGLAFALLLGVPPVMGLYASLAPLVVFAVFAKGRFVSPGPTPAAALATLGAVLPIGSPGSPDFIASVLAVTLVAGLFLILFAAIGLSGFLRYISQPVLNGFTAGLALLVALYQLPALLGLRLEPVSSALGLLHALMKTTASAHPSTLVIALIAIALLANRSRLSAGVAGLFAAPPAAAKWLAQLMPLIVVIGAALVVWAGSLGGAPGVQVVGDIPHGLPYWGFPSFAADRAGPIISAGLTVALVIMIESWSVETKLAENRGAIPASENTLFAMGAANVASGLTGGYPVSGGLARSAVNIDAGAVTPFAGLFTAFGVLAIIIVAPSVLTAVPQAALAAMIFVAGVSQLRVSEFRKAWDWNRAEGVAYLAALLGVLCSGLVWGLATGFCVALALVILRSFCPPVVAVDLEAERDHNQGNRHIRLAVHGELNFLSAPHVEDKIVRVIRGQCKLRTIQIFINHRHAIDSTAHQRLRRLSERLSRDGVRLSYDSAPSPDKTNLPDKSLASNRSRTQAQRVGDHADG
ncbi:MAG: SulP family inorganic anion transporter [Hyphomicrobiales bacterium]|nr:SulP family inorganic anion transporter [Hyphomicrobiales bacterium]